jgi:thiamine biosynthesis lipoprotein
VGADADAGRADAGHYGVIRSALALAAAVALPAGQAPSRDPAPVRVELSEPAMGTLARVVVYAATHDAGEAAARAALARIAALDARLSDYREDSEVAALARADAGVPVPVSDDLFTVLQASDALARRTGGAFDATHGRLTHLWRRARRLNQLPDAGALAAARAGGGVAHVHLDAARRTVTLDLPGIVIDAGGIAKGYAGDEALRVLASRGLPAALVAIGGDVVAGDPPPGRDAWTIAVPRLAEDPHAAAEPYWIGLVRAGVSTSGDAEQWMTVDGVRYSHVLDLRTGKPLVGRRSTSVVASRGIDADALSTAIGILGDAEGAALLQGTAPAPSALWQTLRADGTVDAHHTTTWPAIAAPAPAVSLRGVP